MEQLAEQLEAEKFRAEINLKAYKAEQAEKQRALKNNAELKRQLAAACQRIYELEMGRDL